MAHEQVDHQSFEARTSSFFTNPVRSAVSRIRELQAESLPNGGAVREAGRQRTRDLLATGAFSVAPRR